MLSPRAIYSFLLALALCACGDNLVSGSSTLEVNPTSLQLVVGDSATVAATVSSADGSITAADVTWASSNTEIATVTAGANGR